MGTLMDLVAGETREILLAIALDDWESLADRSRFDAHLALGGGLDLAWLDRFSRALREVTGRPEPLDFSAACEPLSGPTGGEIGERTVERVETSWLRAIADLEDDRIDAAAGRWIELTEADFGEPLEPDEKTWIRALAAEIVAFARAADGAPDTLFAWSI